MEEEARVSDHLRVSEKEGLDLHQVRGLEKRRLLRHSKESYELSYSC
jgi:hypothetical protein